MIETGGFKRHNGPKWAKVKRVKSTLVLSDHSQPEADIIPSKVL